MDKPLRLTPQYRDYLWGGQRLRPGMERTAEAWVVHEQDRLDGGPHAGRSLAELAAEFGEALLGRRAVQVTGWRFPLLIKLLDCNEWLSLQVHPNNEQAVQLEGAGHFGKAEAWYVLEAEPGAQILCGLLPGTAPDALAQAMHSGTILDLAQRLPVNTGETIYIPPGMVHALGPGLFVYEVQQTSDITYRVYDWNRPASSGRKLHIEQSLAVTDANTAGQLIPHPVLEDGSSCKLVRCPYFTLELLAGQSNSIGQDTRGESFHVLTVIEGQATIKGAGWEEFIGCLETVVIPAACTGYVVRPVDKLRMLKAFIED